MKKYFLTLLISLSVFISYAQNTELDTKVTISFDNITLVKAFELLESKAGISMAYKSNLGVLSTRISKNYRNKSAKFILSDLLNYNGLDYKLIDNKVTVFESIKKTRFIDVSGYVYDSESGEVLIGCSIYNELAKVGTVSNNFGFFSIRIPKTDRSLVFSYVGFGTKTVNVMDNGKLNVTLEPSQGSLAEVVVVASQKSKNVTSTQMSKIKLKAAEINAIPAVGGEVDVLKAITLLPGVKQGVDGTSGFYVRGGGPDQNLILLDGVPLYNPYHLWGFLSTFNSDAINNIEITKGAFPARYGGRLSSVLDITTKEGNNQKWQKDFTIGLLSSKASVSGPVVKDKSSVMISLRRTYADLIVVPILAKENKKSETKKREGYNFTDLNLKYNTKISDKDRFFISAFASKDKYYLNTTGKDSLIESVLSKTKSTEKGWSNLVGSFRWNHLFGNKLFVNTTSYYSNYHYYTNSSAKISSTNSSAFPESENRIDYTSTIEDFAVKQDYQYYANNRHTLNFGLGGIYHKFKPRISASYSRTGEKTIDNSVKNNYIQAAEFSLYAEDKFYLSSFMKVSIGLHTSAFKMNKKGYYSIQPRFSSRFMVNEILSLKIGYSHMTQYIHLLTSSGITQSSDLWVPSTEKIKPQQSKQLSIGSALLLGSSYLIETEAYYKKMDNLIDYKDGANFLSSATGWQNKVSVGKGYSYGFELFLKRKSGKLKGWLGYTLSWTNRQFEAINFGREYPYRYDRRHDISLVGTYKFNRKWSLNGSWVFYTGNAVTVPTYAYATSEYDGYFHSWANFPSPGATSSGLISTSGIIEDTQSRNNYRLPNYHRLDITASRKIERKRSRHEFVFGVTNVYNKFNPSFYSVSHIQDVNTGKAKVVYSTKTLFPIMPTISYKISF